MEDPLIQTGAQPETPLEKKRRLSRDRTRRCREKKKDALAAPEDFAEAWPQNEHKLISENPEQHAYLLDRHQTIVRLEAETAEIEKAVEKHLPAEFIDVSFQQIKEDVSVNGTQSQGQIEADIFNNNPLDKTAEVYRRFGFRLQLPPGILQRSRNALIFYALTQKDKNLDWTVVDAAISDFEKENGYGAHVSNIRELIRRYRSSPPALALTDNEIVQRAFDDLHAAQLSTDSL